MNRNLVSHEAADTFYMTDEQVDDFKKNMARKKVKRPLIYFLLGAAGVLTSIPLGIVCPVPIISSILAYTAIGSGAFGFINFHRFVNNFSKYKDNSETKSEGGKHL